MPKGLPNDPRLSQNPRHIVPASKRKHCALALGALLLCQGAPGSHLSYEPGLRFARPFASMRSFTPTSPPTPKNPAHSHQQGSQGAPGSRLSYEPGSCFARSAPPKPPLSPDHSPAVAPQTQFAAHKRRGLFGNFFCRFRELLPKGRFSTDGENQR
jgi:hypothetical protein